MERIDKVLANLGYCARRGVGDFLREHRVTAYGSRIKNGAEKADLHAIMVEGEPLDHPDGIFILLNKPAGYVCSHDPAEGKLVYDLLPCRWMRRNPVPSTIGRLDKDTTGVILITDRTEINHRLSSPKHGIEKVYTVTLDKPPFADCTALFASGTMLLAGETKPCLPAALRMTGAVSAEVTLREGRYHQVKRMFQQCGSFVVTLHRARFGIYSVDGVREGGFVELDPGTQGR